MNRWRLVVVALALAACTATVPSVGSVPVSSAASSAVASGATTRVEGAVKTAAAATLTLADGTTLALGPTTRITRTDSATLADLKSGQFAVITARLQPDGTLLASLVMIFAESTSRLVPPGQGPLAAGNLMTNASIVSIDQVSGKLVHGHVPELVGDRCARA